MQVFGLNALAQPTITVEFIAHAVAVIDAETSKISGTKANIQVRLAKSLSSDRFGLSYRIYSPGKAAERAIIPGSALKWTEEAKFIRGQVDVAIPGAAALNCTAIYDGVAHNHLWLADPEQIQNPRRAAYESFDPKLENLRAIIAGARRSWSGRA